MGGVKRECEYASRLDHTPRRKLTRLALAFAWTVTSFATSTRSRVAGQVVWEWSSSASLPLASMSWAL